MQTPSRIIELVERFRRNYSAYSAASYKEARVRIEFIDPLFRELGWDVSNEQGLAEDYKDVVYEESLRIGDVAKAPDYSFRIGGTRKFFVEAKRPSVEVATALQPAYQLRRYAWSAKLPLSILTDFEEFAVYDCRLRPSKADRPTKARILLFDYSEYPERWPEIEAIFSRDAMLKGSFDSFVETAKTMRGTTEVDSAFLNDIEHWRDHLARNLALRNPELNEEQLNFAVHQTLDRIVFLRICEDRGIEPYGNLRSASSGAQAYSELFRLFRMADDKFNSGLFHFRKEEGRPTSSIDTITPRITLDDAALQLIVRDLYYPDSPYEFSVFPAEILGQVYEQFLGKVIRLTPSHRAVVEEKPEVKRAGGVYYTPAHVVNYIVSRSLGPLLPEPSAKAKPPKITILDPACGSGSFLLGAYQLLLDWHKRLYISNSPEQWAKGKAPKLRLLPNGEWGLTTLERKRILLASIYGVDIDPQAVEVTKLSLLLKVLEGENDTSIARQMSFLQDRVLPDLANNIKCGNSLISPDVYALVQLPQMTDRESSALRPFDWDAEFPSVIGPGGFDVVIGNPPYDVMEKQRGAASWPHAALAEYVKVTSSYGPALGGKLNLFRFFFVRSLQLIRKGGRFGMILPLALLADITSSKARHHLLQSFSDLQADCFPQKDNPRKRIFFGAKLSTVVITGKATPGVTRPRARINVRVFPANSFNDPAKSNSVTLADTELLDPKTRPIPLIDAPEWKVCKRIHKHPREAHLGTVSDYEVTRGEINQTIYREYITTDARKVTLVKGVEIGPYVKRETLSQGQRQWFDEASFLASNPPRPVVAVRRIATQRITGVDERLRVVATMIEPKAYFADSTNSIARTSSASHSLEYLLGFLNSSLVQWRFKITSTNNNVGTNELQSLPFPLIDFANSADSQIHDEIAHLVSRMLDLNDPSKTQGRTPASARAGTIKATLDQIDILICGLFDLDARDIDLITSSLRKGHTLVQ